MTAILWEVRVVRLMRMPAKRQKVPARKSIRAGKILTPRQAASALSLMQVL